MSPFLVLPHVLTKPLRWSEASVRRARHNAYAATAALAVRRAEREEVDQFLSEHGTFEPTVLEQPLAEEVVRIPQQRTQQDAQQRVGR